MSAVLIHPTGIGNQPQARRNWANTIVRSVDFRRPDLVAALTADERRRLESAHPSRVAPFWGTPRHNGAAMSRLSTGDVVIFTGKSAVQAVGRLGAIMDNAVFADLLWPRDAEGRSYRHVYSVVDLRFVEGVSYDDLRRLGQFAPTEPFRRFKVVDARQASELEAAFLRPDGSAADSTAVDVQRQLTDVAVEARPEHTRPASRRHDLGDRVRHGDVVAALQEWGDVGRDFFLRQHGTGASERYVIVVDGREYDARAVLQAAVRRAGTFDPEALYRGDEASVVEPLRRLGFLVADREQPPSEPEPGEVDVAARLAGFAGPTDATAVVTAVRREQSLLRDALGIGRAVSEGRCGLCGRTLPRGLLIAAHVKPRGACSEEERLDMPHVAMVACALGCDALYEAGYVTVAEGGRVLTARRELRHTHLQSHLRELEQRLRAPAWNDRREPYFAWHRQHRFVLGHVQPGEVSVHGQAAPHAGGPWVRR